MKKTLFLLTIVSLAVITASVASYYLIILPRQNTQSQEDINAIRNVIAPTPAQQKVRQQQAAQSDINFKKLLECQMEMFEKSMAYLEQQCPYNPFSTTTNPFDPASYKERDACTERVMNSAEYKKFTCPKPF
jgi:uncharacterized membrane protein (DUF106 family)